MGAKPEQQKMLLKDFGEMQGFLMCRLVFMVWMTTMLRSARRFRVSYSIIVTSGLRFLERRNACNISGKFCFQSPTIPGINAQVNIAFLSHQDLIFCFYCFFFKLFLLAKNTNRVFLFQQCLLAKMRGQWCLHLSSRFSVRRPLNMFFFGKGCVCTSGCCTNRGRVGATLPSIGWKTLRNLSEK